MRRLLESFQLRLPDGMRDRLKRAAQDNNRSMNSEIVRRLEDSLVGWLAVTPDEVLGWRILQKEGSASAPTLPSHGSNNSRQEKAVNRQHDTTAPRGGATALAAIRQTCPVAALTERLTSARAAYRDADTRRIKGRHTGPEANRADRECIHRLDEECAVQAMIACSRADSLEGAAVQIAEIVPNLEVLWDALSDRPDADQTEAYRAAFRLVYSALGAVEQHLAVPLAELVDPQFGERGLDPWRSGGEGGTDHATLVCHRQPEADEGVAA